MNDKKSKNILLVFTEQKKRFKTIIKLLKHYSSSFNLAIYLENQNKKNQYFFLEIILYINLYITHKYRKTSHVVQIFSI